VKFTELHLKITNMKTKLLLASLLLLSFLFGSAQITKTVGSGGNYTTLKTAFDAINAGTLTGAITFQIISNTTETATASLNGSGTGLANYSSVFIYPTGSGYTIGGNISTPLITLSGADNVVIDGSVNASGTVKDLIINNSNTNTSSTIRLVDSAENNSIKNCTIKGSGTNVSGGIISFSTASFGNGNNNNLIDHNDITSSASGRPANAIYSLGTSGRENSGNTISNNYIFDFLNASLYSRGIIIGVNSNDWIVSGNSFYETTTIVPTAPNSYNVIYTGSSTSHLISGNYIGGSAPQCGGSPWTVNSSFAHYFYGMCIGGGATTPVTVQNNVIQNINYTSSHSNPWDGINISSGITNVNIIGNTIGSATGTGSIVITTPNAAATATLSGGVVTAINIIGGGSGFTTAPLITFSASGSTTQATATAIISGGLVTGYNITNGGAGYTAVPSVMFNAGGYSTSHGIRHLNTGVVTITNNNIGSITTIGTDTYSHCFEAIVISGNAPSIAISNNRIGSLTTPNSIQTSSTSASSLYRGDTRGIYINSSVVATTITGNTIANMTTKYMGASVTKLDGVCVSGGSNVIQNNTIRDLSADGASVLVKGIQQQVATAGTNQTVTGNSIYNLFNTNANANVTLTGIQYGAPFTGTNTVSGNFIHSLSVVSSNTNSEIDGIVLAGGVLTCSNNIINIGGSASTGYKIYGIYDNSSVNVLNNNNVYFNSVYVGGTVASGVTSSTAALWNSNNNSIRNYKNNILMNVRSGGTLGKHYAIRASGTVGLTIDYNDYYVSGGGILGNISGVDKNTLVLWKTATAQDINSANIDPGFTLSGGTSPLNYYTSSNLPATAISGITTDYAGLARGTTPKMGALEANDYIWQGTSSTDFATAANWLGGVVPPNGADIFFSANPDRNCVLDQNRTLGNITNPQSTDKLHLNGKQLTLTGSLIFSNGAQIDATASASEIVFAGISAQSIPAGAFVSNTVDAIKVNNGNGLTLNNDFTVVQSLTLTSGAFILGANTLTLNGAITSASGSLTGGNSTNISIGGSGSSTILPAITVNNLTLNRTNGLSLGGNVNVTGTLDLASGTLVVGANTLTISGGSPTRTTGNLDASNTSATLVFANASAITLPSGFFAGSNTNLTLTGGGGVTAGSDITVNGVLNLAAANPSSTRGLLEMTQSYSNYPGTTITDYLNSYILNMGSGATTIGTGDVTGTIKRATIVANTPYTFGHQYNSITLSSGDMPTAISITITIGNTPPDNPNGIKRTFEIVPTLPEGFTANSHLSANFHFLDSEMTSSISPYHLCSKSKMVTSDYDIGGGFATPDEHGRASYDFENNYIGMSNIPISYFIQIPITHAWRTIFSLRDYEAEYYTWDGSAGADWGTSANWTPSGVPGDLSHVIIPNAATTPNDPILGAAVTINTLSIEKGGVLVMGNETLTIKNSLSGGWEDQNILGNDPGASTVIFTMPGTTISGNARFYNVEIATGADITNQTASTMKIANTITKTGTGRWFAAMHGATIEYNGGNQTVITTDTTPYYHNLILSGSGTKTLPAVAMSLDGNLTLKEAVTTTAASAFTIGGDLIIGETATFNSGNFNHIIQGNFDNSGTFNAAVGYSIAMNGLVAQSILGITTTTFDKLTINNSNGVGLYANANVNNVLTLADGNFTIGEASLGINGTINKTAGFINLSPVASLSFGGTAALTLANNLFATVPSINNLEINRSGGVTLGNQSLTVNGLLNLTSGTFNIAANNLTIGALGSIVVASPNATKMIIASDSGELRKIFSAAGTFLYPIGDNTATVEYSPLTLTLAGDSFVDTYFGIKVANAKHPNNASTTNFLNRYWTVSQSGITSFEASIDATYTNADVVGVETNGAGAQLNNTFNQETNPWIKHSSLVANTLSVTNSTFDAEQTSVFTGINNATPTVSITGAEVTVCSGTNVSLGTTVSADPTVSYSWSPADFLSSTTISNPVATNITATTIYTVTIKDGNGISASSAPKTISMGNTTTWNGTTWDNLAPTSLSSAIIAGNYNVAADITACTLTINSGTVVIPSDFNVILNGALTVNSGSFALSNNANLIQSSTAVNFGNINVNRNSNALYRLDYTLWSSPVSGSQTLANFSPLTATARFYTYNPATNLYNTILPTNPFGTGTSYLIRMPNEDPNNLGGGSTYSLGTDPITYNGVFTGVPNNGDINLNGLIANAYYAIGNPYPSTISASSFFSGNATTGTLYFWRKRNNSAATSYATYTGLAGVVNSGDPNTIVPNGTIQVGQGFIVKPTSTSLSFTNAMRTANNSNQILKTKTVEKHRIWLNLTNGTTPVNQMAVGYMTEATIGIDDGIDGRYINDSQTALNSVISNEEFIIQGRSLPFDGADVVPLAFKTTTAGDFTIAIDHVDGLFSGSQDIFLRDNTTGTETDLKAGAYTFTAAAGVDNARFSLKYQRTLGVNSQIFDENSVVVYKNKGGIQISTGKIVIDNVKVFDIQGRLIAEQKNVKATSATIKDLKVAQQVLIVKITSVDNQTVSRKVVD
jgi:hypothetical protein